MRAAAATGVVAGRDLRNPSLRRSHVDAVRDLTCVYARADGRSGPGEEELAVARDGQAGGAPEREVAARRAVNQNPFVFGRLCRLA